LTDGTFAALGEGFETARRAGSLTESSFTFAGRPVRMRVAGRSLARRIERPLAHLAARARAPELTIDLWEAKETGIPPPVQAGADEAVTSSPDGRYLAYARPYSVTALDRRRGHLVGCVESGASLSDVERARPLNLALTVWCGDQGVQLIHAGLVAADGHGVLVAGMAEAGKSTTALACAAAGFDFLADDCVALSRSADGTFEGHSLYASASLEPGHLARFAPLPPTATDGPLPGDEKSLIFLRTATRVAPISLVALPRIVPAARAGVCRAGKGEALLRLAPGSLIKRAVSPRECMRAMANLVDQVPAFWLDLDSDVGQIPRRVEALLGEAGLA
jgi:hypothetical protein